MGCGEIEIEATSASGKAEVEAKLGKKHGTMVPVVLRKVPKL